MKKLAAAAAALLLGLLAQGCAGGGEGGQTSPSPQANPLAAVEWVDGTPPSLDFATPFDLGQDTAFRVAKPGDGDEAGPGDALQLHYIMVAGQDGTVIASTYDQDQTYLYQMAAEAPADDYVWAAVNGQQAGANVIAAFRTEGEAAGDASATPVPAQTYLVALTIVSVQEVPQRAQGETVVPEDPNLPQVALDADGRPSITIPEGAEPPAELVSQLLIRGSGAQVAETQSVTANYSGWLWDGTQFDSSWDRGEPSSFSLQEVIAGWTEGLAGVPVGSQVLLVIPPDLGYGANGSGSTIPPDSTLIFVVDVLAAA
ncbi:MAG: FKBP-type peptidyl-prolyl cis-trans isomerase [Bifidobacteriaceae bacterium]|jgi:peptidylprolyl isomerase|nr:FKBP-type peptidyl-prolyl cis-trans isomerase [Bifidobacteriaceae bacterium]